MSIASDISSWLNNNRKVVRHKAPVTMSKWIRDWSFSSEVLVKFESLICREKVEGDHKIVPRRLLYYEIEMIEKLLDMLSIKRFEEWLTKSRKGDKVTYYRGYIMAPHLQKFSPTTDERRVNSLKKRVQHAYHSNIITLVQRRHGDLDYEYIAVRI